MQGRNRDTDVENGHMNIAGEREGRINWESSTDIYIYILLLLLLLSRFSRVRHCDPIDGSPPGSPIPGILQARTLEWVAISFSNA